MEKKSRGICLLEPKRGYTEAMFLTKKFRRVYKFKNTNQGFEDLKRKLKEWGVKDIAIVFVKLSRTGMLLKLFDYMYELLPDMCNRLKDEFNIIFVDKDSPIIKEGAPERHPGESKSEWLAYLLWLGKLESNYSIESMMRHIKIEKEFEATKARKVPAIKKDIEFVRMRAFPTFMAIIGVIIGTLIWSGVRMSLIEIKATIAAYWALAEFFGITPRPRAVEELFIEFILIAIFAAITGVVAGGLGQFALFLKKYWRDERKLSITSTLLETIFAICSLSLGYYLMFGELMGAYFSTLWPLDLFLYFVAILAAVESGGYVFKHFKDAYLTPPYR